VGDTAFRRVLARMADMKRDGITILIVSHAMPRLKRLCRAILYRVWMISDGISDEVINIYQNTPQYSSTKDPKLSVETSEARDNQGSVRFMCAFMDSAQSRKDVSMAKKFIARISYQADHIRDPVFEV
jgi:ABC-type multidrug transport system ATPase subunit